MREEGVREDESGVSLFETKEARFRGLYKVFAATIFGAICLIWVYRVVNMGRIERGRWCWMSVMVSEFGFGFYWIITQSVRWRILYHTPFKHILLNRSHLLFLLLLFSVTTSNIFTEKKT